MAIFENYPYIFDTKIDMYSKIKDTCQKVNYIFMWDGLVLTKLACLSFFQTEVIMNRFINLYEPANCLIQSMENLMENDDQQMYSELMNGLNDGLMRKIYALKAGAWERFLPRGGPSNTKNEIFPILKIFTL